MNRLLILFLISLTPNLTCAQSRILQINDSYTLRLDSILNISKNHKEVKAYIVIINYEDSEKFEHLFTFVKYNKLNNNFCDLTLFWHYKPSDTKVCTDVWLPIDFGKGIKTSRLPYSCPIILILPINEDLQTRLSANPAYDKLENKPDFFKCYNADSIISLVLEISKQRVMHIDPNIENDEFNTKNTNAISYNTKISFSSGITYSVNNSFLKEEIMNSSFVTFGLNRYPENFIKNLGYGIGFSLDNLTINTTAMNKFTDNLGIILDQDGQKFNGYVTANNLKEQANIQYFSISPHLIYSLPFSKKSSFRISGAIGVHASGLVFANYHAIDGTTTYNGIYKNDYDSVKPMFFDIPKYGYFTNQKVNTTKQPLHLNPFSVFLFASVYGEYYPKSWNGLGINAGLEGILWSSNLLNNSKEESVLSHDPQHYNSLLYRLNDMKINSLAFSFGLSYKY